jgi:hypothetical protein
MKMRDIGRLAWLPLVFLVAVICATSGGANTLSDNPAESQTILVGHISHVEGQLLRYVSDKEDWITTVRDTPFGLDDALHSEENSRAELILPNNTWVRMDGDTHIQLIVLNDEVTGIDVKSGVARFYNKGTDTVIKVTTPVGYVTALAGSGFDLNVGDDLVEVSTFKGKVDFLHSTDHTRMEVIAGSLSIIANYHQVISAEVHLDSAWEKWNRKRDKLWQKRAKLKGESANYLPSRLNYEAYILEKHGRWSRVYYDGGYYYFWRPVYVGIGWAPFTAGRWMVWYGDHCWIPNEPFGYITHHYGNWIFVRGLWYWAPPAARVRVRLGPPILNIEFAWNPGRVAWVHSKIHIGWVPLDPREPYNSYRSWGRRAIVVNNVNVKKINTNIKNYKYLNHAVIIKRKNFFDAKSYSKHRIRNIKSNALINNNYHATPFVDGRGVKYYKSMRLRHKLMDAYAKKTPQGMISNRIRDNRWAKKSAKNASNNRHESLAKRNPKRYLSLQNNLAFSNETKKIERKSKLKGKGNDRKVKLFRKKKGPDTNQLSKRRTKRLLKSAPKQLGQLKKQKKVGSPTQKAQQRRSSNKGQRQGAILKGQVKTGGLIQNKKGKKLFNFVLRGKKRGRTQLQSGRTISAP